MPEASTSELVFRLETAVEPGLEADLIGSLGLIGPALSVTDARFELEEDLRRVVTRELPGARVEISFARGSIIVWIVVKVAEALVEGVTWMLVERLTRRLRQRLRDWLSRRFGVQAEVSGSGWIALPEKPRSTASFRQLTSVVVAVIALAAIAQLTLAFVVVWLLVTN